MFLNKINPDGTIVLGPSEEEGKIPAGFFENPSALIKAFENHALEHPDENHVGRAYNVMTTVKFPMSNRQEDSYAGIINKVNENVEALKKGGFSDAAKHEFAKNLDGLAKQAEPLGVLDTSPSSYYRSHSNEPGSEDHTITPAQFANISPSRQNVSQTTSPARQAAQTSIASPAIARNAPVSSQALGDDWGKAINVEVVSGGISNGGPGQAQYSDPWAKTASNNSPNQQSQIAGKFDDQTKQSIAQHANDLQSGQNVRLADNGLPYGSNVQAAAVNAQIQTASKGGPAV